MLVTKLVKDPMLCFMTKENIPRIVLNCGSSLHRVGDSSPSQRIGTPNSGVASNFNMAGHRDISLRSGIPSSSTPSSRPGVQVPKKKQAFKLLIWYNEGEVVSHGRIHETDPKKKYSRDAYRARCLQHVRWLSTC